MPPHGPAQNREAAIPCSHVARHLAEIVQAELGGWSHLKWHQLQLFNNMCIQWIMSVYLIDGESIFTCRAPNKKGSMRGHMLTLSASILKEKGNRTHVRHMIHWYVWISHYKKAVYVSIHVYCNLNFWITWHHHNRLKWGLLVCILVYSWLTIQVHQHDSKRPFVNSYLCVVHLTWWQIPPAAPLWRSYDNWQPGCSCHQHLTSHNNNFGTLTKPTLSWNQPSKTVHQYAHYTFIVITERVRPFDSCGNGSIVNKLKLT